MAPEITQEGEIPFDIPDAGKPCFTWFKTYGNFESGEIPLITLHGGPGACHEYMMPLVDLTENLKIPVVLYDQMGNGKSTRLREKAGDEDFWAEELFQRELDNLIDHLGLRRNGFDLCGQSWGGMLAAKYAAGKPKGLRKLILANAPASVELLLVGENALRHQLPDDVRQTLDECERDGKLESKEYEAACMEFYKRFLCRLDPWPPEVEIALGHLKEDPTVYQTMFGPSEMFVTGNLRNWTAIDDINKIDVPTLVLNGRFDEVQDIAVAPFFEKLNKVKWLTLENSSHMGFFEERERYMTIIGSFLRP